MTSRRRKKPSATRRNSTSAGITSAALEKLNERERRIFETRRLAEDAITLENLAQEFGVSRERIRQIEVRAFEKVQDAVQQAAKSEDSGRLH